MLSSDDDRALAMPCIRWRTGRLKAGDGLKYTGARWRTAQRRASRAATGPRPDGRHWMGQFVAVIVSTAQPTCLMASCGHEDAATATRLDGASSVGRGCGAAGAIRGRWQRTTSDGRYCSTRWRLRAAWAESCGQACSSAGMP